MKQIQHGLPESKRNSDLFSLFTSNIKKIHVQLERKKSQKIESVKQKSMLSTAHTDNAGGSSLGTAQRLFQSANGDEMKNSNVAMRAIKVNKLNIFADK